MPKLPDVFNTETNNEKLSDSSLLPEGAFLVSISSSSFKQTKSNDQNWYLELNAVVMEGQYKGRIHTFRLNLRNTNPTAVDIANRTLNSICSACNKQGVSESEMLHGIPFGVRLNVKESADGKYKNNEEVAYLTEQEARAAPDFMGEAPVEMPAPAAPRIKGVPESMQPQTQPTEAPAPVQEAPAAGKLPWE